MAIEGPSAPSVAAQRPVATSEPFPAQSPRVDASKLNETGRQLNDTIVDNRATLVQRHTEAVQDRQPQIAARIAVLVRKLDEASGLLAQKPVENLAAAHQIAQSVNSDFDTVAADWRAAPAAAAATTPATTRPADTVEARPAATATTAAPSDARLAALEGRLTELETQNAQMRDQIEAKEKAEAEEAKKPGFKRALLEVFEFIGRWFTPFFNLISAAFRVLKIGFKLLTGKKVDWMNEGIRLAGDVAGIFFPPLGALTNAGMNLWKNESQVMGGMNEIFDKEKKDNPFRSGFEGAVDWVKDTYNAAKATITGDAPKPSEGSVDFRPVAPELAT